ncbi:hypothetical protein Y1Q_0009727 [Alligator mississippiensis]|uniref:Uncharacterized protein n=1 Tax=Alligator mississippiensis TaxID=8496 RepID=A0A151MWP9_ALLMI|nr:hypothetical protein Y1Q_0009727 [Alligator mississippiensis]
MPRGMAQPRAMRETDEEDLDTFLMAGWKLAMIPRSERPRQTPEDSYTPRPQRKEEDASALSPTDERLGLEVGPSTTIDGELPRNMQVRKTQASGRGIWREKVLQTDLKQPPALTPEVSPGWSWEIWDSFGRPQAFETPISPERNLEVLQP